MLTMGIYFLSELIKVLPLDFGGVNLGSLILGGFIVAGIFSFIGVGIRK